MQIFYNEEKVLIKNYIKGQQIEEVIRNYHDTTSPSTFLTHATSGIPDVTELNVVLIVLNNKIARNIIPPAILEKPNYFVYHG